ncbi:MAG TPA: O-antigen ligase family protein [Beijerinckiaceae bacterium]
MIFWSIAGTWGFWLLGALYLVAPVLGWSLLALGLWRLSGDDGERSIASRPFPIGVLVWTLAMGFMLVALVVAHLDYNLGMPQLIKSSMGWAKGWALMAVFPLVGAMFTIRPRIIYRASCILGLQTLCLAPLLVLAMLVGVPGKLYVSPLMMVGGPGPEFFDVELYSYDASTGNPRWRFFAPWAPAAAFVASIYFVFALAEGHRVLKGVGLFATAVMCVLSQSRLGLLTMPAVAILTLGLSNLTRPKVLAIGAIAMVCSIFVLEPVLVAVEDAAQRIAEARAASTRVRATLGSIAVHRWVTEAPIFGHGVVERGPHLVEYMPIGSHHSWYGLLFVKGAVGFAALALPLAWTIVELIFKAQASRTARTALGVALVLLSYSFGENLEILSYLFWPGLIVIGIAMRRPLKSPFRVFTRSGVPRPA